VSRRSAAPARKPRGRNVWTVEFLTSPAFLFGLSVVALCLLGLVMVFSATSVELAEAGKPVWTSLRSQAVFMAVGVLAALAARMAPGWLLRNTVVLAVLWVAIVALLAAVLVVGTTALGATRQLALPGGLSFQPSEFAKIVLIMISARVLSDWESRTISGLQCLLVLGGALGVPLALIFLEKDLGTLLIIGGAVLLLALLAGLRFRYFVIFVVACGALACFAIVGYRVDRIVAWLDPWADGVYSDEGWQLAHSLYAFAIGGLTGSGVGTSHEKYSWLPEAENDFIFAVVGEEMGLVGCLVVVGLFVLLCVSGLRISYQARARSRAASFLAGGLTLAIGVQTLLNMGGVTQVLPLSGRPLPFMSLGGSSVIACLLMAGLILGVARENDRYEAARYERELRAAARENLTVIDGGAAGGEPAPARTPGRTEAPRTRPAGPNDGRRYR
jgi:cell division protein FtsW